VLLGATTKGPIDPVVPVTDKKIEMTPWELRDMAVQVVRDYLEKQKYQLMFWQGNPEVDPAIWFVGDSKGSEWVVVRAIRYPANQASRPANWQAIADQCVRINRIGRFASVAMVSMERPFKLENEQAIPLWSGHGMHVRFTDLE
jgi:hypothetical protein